MMTTYAAGFVAGLLTGAAAATVAWVLANLRSRAWPAQRHLEPLPGPPQLSDQITTAHERRRPPVTYTSADIEATQDRRASPR